SARQRLPAGGAGHPGRRPSREGAVTVHSAGRLAGLAPRPAAPPARALAADVNSDRQSDGLDARVVIDRDTAARLGVSANAIDQALYDAFGQRQVSTIYT